MADEADNRVPDESDFYRIESYWETPWGNNVAPRWVVIGWAEYEQDKFGMELPNPCESKFPIINHGKPRDQQVWTLPETPYYWTDEHIKEMAETEYKHLKEEAMYWWKDNATQEMADYAEEQWGMRWDGVHIWIDGRIEWLPGFYWMWLRWVRIDTGRPQYIQLQHWVALVLWWSAEDKSNHGIIWLKWRRIGGTLMFLWEGLDHVTKYADQNMGLQGYKLKEIEEDFQEKMVPMWRNLPWFFRTENDGSDDPKSGFRFKEKARSGKKKFKGGSGGNNSNVYLSATDTKAKQEFDRLKLARFFRDEWNKTKTDIYAGWRDIKRTMESMGRILGRARMPSTAGDASNANVKVSQKMYTDSLPSNMEGGNGRTISGMRALFFPAYSALWLDNISFIDRFGKGIIGHPTDDQMAFLLETQPQNESEFRLGGAWHWMQRYMSKLDDRSRYAFRRQYPITPRDAFKSDAGTAHIDPVTVGNTLDTLNASRDGVKYHEKLTVRCSIVPENHNPSDTRVLAILSRKMRIVPDPKGMWLFRRDFVADMGELWAPNAVPPVWSEFNKRYEYRITPTMDFRRTGNRFCLGIDPIDKDKSAMSTSTKLSDLAVTVRWKYDHSIDGGKEREKWKTYSPVAHFRHRTESKVVMFLEIAKAMVLFGSMAHIENTRGDALIDWLKQHGMDGLVMRRPWETLSEKQRTDRPAPVAGTPASDDLYQKGIYAINEWVVKYSTPENCPFVQIWEDYRDVDPGNMQPFDSFVSDMFAYFGSGGGTVDEPEKTKYIGTDDLRMKRRPPVIGHSPDKYRI